MGLLHENQSLDKLDPTKVISRYSVTNNGHLTMAVVGTICDRTLCLVEVPEELYFLILWVKYPSLVT